MTARFRQKPVVIEASDPLTEDNAAEIAAWVGGKAQIKTLPGPGRGAHTGVVIHTLEGDMKADLGDRVIRGVRGEFYPCKSLIFDETYEPVD